LVTRSGTTFEERVARVLVEGGFINARQLEQGQQLSREKGTSLLDMLVAQGALARETLTTVLSVQLRVPTVDLRHVQVDPEAIRLLPEEYARDHHVLPFGFASDGSLRVATKSPDDFQLSAQLSSMSGRQVKFALALGEGLETLIDRAYSAGAVSPAKGQPPAAGAEAAPRRQPSTATATTAVAPGGTAAQVPATADDISRLPAIQAVEMVTLQAVKRRASDIHVVPTPDSSKVLFRIDGILQNMTMLPLTLHESMVSRVKVLAGMDISERRRPQDGSFPMTFGERHVDFRVSTVGTAWGEMMVIRVLDRAGRVLALEEVGLDSGALLATRRLLELPHGMFMVSGPTGAGKTTTLYAAVMELVNDRGNIMSIEDPIEYRTEQINQIEVNRAAGVDFPSGLRSIMRLDPDVILVGEIRDAETASTAVDAALTGHLVLASIHANDAAAAVVRLLELGTQPYLVATSVVGSLAQRLVRKICPQCRILADLNDADAIAYEQEMQEPAGQFWVGQGCNFCGGTGFSGRTGVFEVLSVQAEVRRLIAAGASGQQIREQALADGMVPMLRAGLIKAKAGTTTVREVLRNVFTIG